MDTYNTIGVTIGQFTHDIVRPMLDQLREVDSAMRALTPLPHRLQHLVNPFLNRRLIARNRSRSESRRPDLATGIVFVTVLEEEQAVAVNLARDVGLAFMKSVGGAV